MAVEVLLGDFMEAEVDFAGGEVDFVEVEVGEVTAKPHGLFPINHPDQYSGLFWFGRFGIISLK
jgi:hypothetical protein